MANFLPTLAQVQKRATQRTFFPDLEPYSTFFLDVSEESRGDKIKHRVYVEQYGNPQGKPVIVQSGGPGAGAERNLARLHDPAKWRIILHDQRGCLRATPHACVEENTTWHLVSDMEKIRKHLNIERWSLYGGSWGSTLSLVYAISHPERVTDMIIRGIFLLRPFELKFFYEEGGAGMIWPEAWEKFRDFIPREEREKVVAMAVARKEKEAGGGEEEEEEEKDIFYHHQEDFPLMKAYNRRLFSDDENVRREAAMRWSIWEGSVSYSTEADSHALAEFEDPDFMLAFARIENSYFMAKPFPAFFPTDNYIIENAHKIAHLPITIVQGRMDVVCPMRSAYDLKKALPKAEFVTAPLSGHSYSEPDVLNLLIAAGEKYAS